MSATIDFNLFKLSSFFFIFNVVIERIRVLCYHNYFILHNNGQLIATMLVIILTTIFWFC